MQTSVQVTWSWKIAAYLFLAGTGSGAYAVSVLAASLGLVGPLAPAIGVALGAPLVFAGMLFLINDLGVKKNAVRAFINVRTSWMARGSWIISIFTILDAAQLASMLWRWEWPAALDAVTVVFAVVTMFYTGFLLKSCRAISFWSTIILPFLFLISASSTGAMAVVLGGVLYGSSVQSFSALSRADAVLILFEALVIAVYLARGRRVRPSRESVHMWINGRLAIGFWGGAVLCGLLIPLVADAYSGGILVVSVSMSLGLAGGLFLRKIILAAGARDSLVSFSPASPFWGNVIRDAASG